jgi:hypothetical protein
MQGNPILPHLGILLRRSTIRESRIRVDVEPPQVYKGSGKGCVHPGIVTPNLRLVRRCQISRDPSAEETLGKRPVGSVGLRRHLTKIITSSAIAKR